MNKSSEGQPDRWYSVELPLSYKVLSRPDLPQRGIGHVHAMSRHRIAVTLGLPQVDADRIELLITWPARLNGVIPLNLFVEGPLVWDPTERTHFVHMMYHEFRLAGAATRKPHGTISKTELS